MTPKLRFPLYNQPFVKKSINEILTIGSGKDYKHLSKGEIPVYGTGGLMTTVNDHLYDGESVGIGRKGTIDKPIFLKGKFWTVDTLFYTHSFEDVDPYYVFILFQQINWKKYNEASGVPSLSKTTVGAIQVYVPRIEEQLRIRSLFEAVDQKINLLTKKKEALETYKKGLMQKIFSQELRFKREDGTDYPEWETLRIEDISEERSERGFENYPLLSITLHNGIVPQELGGKSDSSSSDKSNYKLIKVGDIGYNSMRMWQGASGVSSFEGIVSPAYTVFKLNERADAQFVGFLFKTQRLIGTFKSHSQGLTSDTWNLKYPTLKRIKIMLPSIDEQLKVVQILSQFDVNIESLSKRIEAAEQLKKGLLQQMFV